MDSDTRKATIRRLALARRSRLDPAERSRGGAQIVRRLLELPEVAGADPVLAFVSIRSEVPTDVMLSAVLDAGKTLLLPYVADDGSLRAAPVSSLAEIEPGYRGIPEPRPRLRLVKAEPAVIIVPGVAFDATGARLGYGGGFYDRYLAAAPGVPRVGVCFEAQLFEEIPVEPHDEPVDIIVTEERAIRCSRT
ncbi:MAG TPA: 5-formyltetrahydrofolate cyclo-ligase [Actinomycetota bacterium]|jgi:5-formyltetrahydrofolate cyclo-ligase